jgi:uncharacterized membrane protein YeaQ/YmgE (transglycosylase-associated protein family)
MNGCLGFIAILILLSIIGWVIDLIVPGKMPYGWLGGIVAAIVGGLLGGFLFGNFGPAASFSGWTLSFIPALLGGIIVAVIIRFIMGSQGRRSL